MFDFINYGVPQLQIFLLLVIRASGLFLTAPVLSHQLVQAQVKVGLVLLLAVVTMPTVAALPIIPAQSLADLAAMVLRELMVGLLIGFAFRLLFEAVDLAGSLAGYQVGLAVASAFDPNAGEETGPFGRFWIFLATVIFLAINGHHLVIRAFNESFRVIMPGQMQVSGTTAELMMQYTGYVFVLALKIAAPVLITLILMDVALGTISKVMPTMNIFIVGFPVKIGVGILVVAMSLPVFSYVLQKSTDYFERAVSELLLSMGKV
ncbi:MAG: flagellar biosynthetic protein FliR [candidate division Zixibacteria bacterium]|nr:flagellar biosynthetic protein FliR [candidate division Zixibacteria bacterium]